MAFQQAGGQGPIPTLAKPQRFNDASVYATTWSLACFIFRFVHGPLPGAKCAVWAQTTLTHERAATPCRTAWRDLHSPRRAPQRPSRLATNLTTPFGRH